MRMIKLDIERFNKIARDKIHKIKRGLTGLINLHVAAVAAGVEEHEGSLSFDCENQPMLWLSGEMLETPIDKERFLFLVHSIGEHLGVEFRIETATHVRSFIAESRKDGILYSIWLRENPSCKWVQDGEEIITRYKAVCK